jgi:hypothetical protein
MVDLRAMMKYKALLLFSTMKVSQVEVVSVTDNVILELIILICVINFI